MQGVALEPIDGRGGRYVVTSEDLLWLLRAVEAEGPPQASVARALVNLFVYLRQSSPGIWGARTLAQLVRSYAQPVSPAWAHGGERDTTPGAVTAREARRAIASQRVSFGEVTRGAVREALESGTHSGDVTDYAAHTLDAARKGYVLRVPGRDGLNALWTRSPGWSGYRVVAESERLPVAEGGEVVPEQIEGKVSRVRALAQRLPREEKGKVLDALDQLVELSRRFGSARVGAFVAPPSSAPAREWDLAIANALDALYEATSERVEVLAGQAVQNIVRPAWQATLPLLIIVAVVAGLYLAAKNGRA
jgi:hypothetical protein